MSSSGFRGRSFGPRGARSDGPTNGFNGPRFPHPSFRPLHRLPGPEKWIERPSFISWQQNKNFLPHPQYRCNLPLRPNNRRRAASGRGIIRFSGPGRPPAPQFCMGFIRNPIPRVPLSQEEQVEDKSAVLPQTPLLGSEEERQQKITETADKLKQKLSSITEEELTNFWEDDLSVLPNNGSDEKNTQNKGIPELRHEPPELDLTFTDFKDIGRVDCNNLKLENVNNISNTDEISIIFEEKSTDGIMNTSDEITIVDESKEEHLNTLDSEHDKSVLNESNILKNKCQKHISHELSDSECNLVNLHLKCTNVSENLISSNLNDIGGKVSTSNFEENVINLITKKPSDLNDFETSISELDSNSKDVLQLNLSKNQNTVQINMKDVDTDITQNTNVGQIDSSEVKLVTDNQVQNNLQVDVSQEEEVCQNFNFPSSNEEIYSTIASDSKSSTCLSYNEAYKLNDDKESNNSPVFQSRIFNIPPRFTPRTHGPRCRWTFQQNGKNLSSRGQQRLPFHVNQTPSSRHITSFKPSDFVTAVFDPREPPPFIPNVPATSHDPQHNALVPFSTNELPLAFDPSEPPPNIRSKVVIESSSMQENMQSVPSLNIRNQTLNTLQSIKLMQPPPAFDLIRGPPPGISNITVATNEKFPEFNPQQPPPKIHKWDETLQPPPIFDPRLSSQERSNLIAPLDSSRANIITVNLMETSQVSDFNIVPNFSQLPPINISSHQAFISNVQMNFQPVLPQASNGQTMMREFALPPPPVNVTDIPPPLPKEPSVERNSNSSQGGSMDDGLEDMQEAMEFAKQIMNMTGEIKNENVSSKFSELPLIPSEIPVPNEDVPYSSSIDEVHPNIVKKQKKKENKNKKCKRNVVCGPELILEKQEKTGTIDEEQNVQNQNKNIEEMLLTNDQIRPKVVFNLSSKTKKIHKPEEWHRSISSQENKESFQQGTAQKKMQLKKSFSENKKNNTNQDKNQQKENNVKINSAHHAEIINISVQEKLSNTLYQQDYTKDLENSHPDYSNTVLLNNMSTQKNQKSKKEFKKMEAPTSESTWKNRVISRFLKMSKNDICNMVNNSSLRKFDIAMKHLVKERRSSLSLEMRNTEGEKMKEYDREEFMNQLNAMLDPGAIVGITDLPTEFIHHLSEVLQLDPMPFDLELCEKQSTDIDETKNNDQSDVSEINICKHLSEENKVQPFTEYLKHQNTCVEHTEDRSIYNKKELSHYSLNTELNLNNSQESTDLLKRSLSNKLNLEVENTCKKHQPLFNEADLDDILSEVTSRTKQITKQNMISSLESERVTETLTDSTMMQTVTEALEHNPFSQIPNRTVADLDDIFSAGIAQVKLFGKDVDSDNLRTRKSSSEDRSTFKSERYERWNRKEQEDPDTFRNLTKEEWEAKYGSINVTVAPTITWKSASNSDENLSRENKNYCAQRYCSSDSPMRHLSISPLTCEIPVDNLGKHTNCPELEELQRVERSQSSSNSSLSSSSDSDEETVAPNVTKLLKVIKEKEKIAKKKSLNETIRDEVAAEIEKKWKEKSKHKERKSRKREKRKKDRRERRKKEKKKKRKRNCHSDASKSSEQMEEFRLLTEDEIKKEVIVKEEPVNTLEENIVLNDEINDSCGISTSANKSTDLILQTESQNSQIEKQQVSGVTCNIISSKIKNKPTIVSMVVQPKTKAQLKQMPESSNTQQKQTAEDTIEVIKNSSIINVNNGKMKDQTKKNKHDELTENNNEQMDTVLSMSNSFYPFGVSLNVKEPFSFFQSELETTGNNNRANTKLLCSISNPITEVNVNNQCANQKIHTINTSLTESKSGYKKIDIKAYKERALQRRLKEQAMLKENSGGPTSLPQDLYHTPSINEINVESLTTMNEVKITEVDISKVQTKDPRLTKTTSISTLTLEDSNKEVKEKTHLEEEYQYTNIFQRNKEFSVFIQSKGVSESEFKIKEKNKTQSIDTDMNVFTDSVKVHKSDSKSFSQETIIAPEFKEFHKKTKILSPTVESTKFKNIRSEGSKELKLKKEKIKKFTEKKKQSLTIEKHVGKYVKKEMTEGTQEPSIVSTNSIVQAKVEKTNNCKNHESLLEHQTELSETFFSSESEINRKTSCKQIDTYSMVKENSQKSISNDTEQANINEKIINQVNEEVLEDQQIADQETIQTQSCESLSNLKSERDSTKKVEEGLIKTAEISITSTECLPIENINKKESSYKETLSIRSNIHDHVSSISIEKCTEDVISSVDYVNKELNFLDKHTNVGIKKDMQLTNGNTISAVQIDSEIINENDNINLKVKANDPENQNNNKPTLQLQDVQILNDYNKEDETRSPDSSSSPFKGFFTESIENDICQVPHLYNLNASNENGKKYERENSKRWLEPCLNDKLSTDSTQENHATDNASSDKKKESNEIMLISNLIEKQNFTKSDSGGRTIHDNSKITVDIETNPKTLEIGNRDIIAEQNKTYNAVIKPKNKVINIQNQETFNEDSEPFIVLDEYIDDADVKSMEKLSTLDLELEDCIARDAVIFTNKHLQEEKKKSLTDNIKTPNFNKINFKDLSEVFDKNNVNKEQNQSHITSIEKNEEVELIERNNIPSKELIHKDTTINTMNIIPSSSETNIELNLKISKDLKPSNSIVSEIPVESLQKKERNMPHINETFESESQRSITPGLSYKESRTKERNLHTTDMLKNNLQYNSESFNTRSRSTSFESETSLKLSVPATTTMKKSSQNLCLITASINEVDVEFLKLNKQTSNSEQRNEKKLNNSFVDKMILKAPTEIKTCIDKDVCLNSIIEQNTSKNLNKNTLERSSKKEKNETLHKIKNKSKMKHRKQKKDDVSEKMVKEAVKSDTVEVKYPSTKEAIMARMIEIDVEIHKLMTEKMTLYQMLTNDTLPSDHNLEQNNIVHENQEDEIPAVRPRTPSMLMSQLIQNIEISPVTNQCSKTITETVCVKDSGVNPVQSYKSKISSKQENHAGRKESCSSTYDSNEEEITYIEGVKSLISRKKKKHKSETEVNKLKNKSEISIPVDNIQETAVEKKQVNDATKLMSGKVNAKQVTAEHDSSHISINVISSQENSNGISIQQINKEDFSNNNQEETLISKVSEKTVESKESQIFIDEIVQSKVVNSNEESCLIQGNEDRTEISDGKGTSASLTAKPLERKTPEKSSIYSDDSTWDSCLQNSSVHDQRKLNTGLALLEETYRKEIAKTRKIKAETRKKKKKKMQNLLQTVNTLTPEEEELPLSMLYVKKLNQKKKLPNFRNQQLEQKDNDQQLWKNVVEVINAVAENRTEELYVERSERQSSGDIEGIVANVPDSEANSKSKLLESKKRQTIFSSILRNVEEANNKSSMDCKIFCENKGEINNESEDNSQLISSFNKLQSCLYNKERIQQELEVDVSSENTEGLSGIPVCNMSTNTEKNLREPSIQKNVETSSLEGSQLYLIEDSNSCIMKSNTNNLYNNQPFMDILKTVLHTEYIQDEKIDTKIEEFNLQEKNSNNEKNIVTEKLSDIQQMITMSKNSEKHYDNLIGSSNYKNLTTDEITYISKEDCDFSVNKDQFKDSPVSFKKISINNISEECNYEPQDKYFINLKEHKGMQKRRESERSNKVSSEENNNRSWESVTFLTKNIETLKSEETLGKKSSKRKKEYNKTPLRRSSRYAEEIVKRIKLEVDANSQNSEQELQEKHFQMQFPSVSSTLLSLCDEETENKKSKFQKAMINRKRFIPESPEVEILPNQLTANEELARGIKRSKQYTMSEMMNCKVRLVDCKHIILNSNVNSNILQKYGISTINSCVYLNSTRADPSTSSMQSTSNKNLQNICTKQTGSTTECSQSQPSKLINRFEDITQSINDQMAYTKVGKVLKPVKMNCSANDKEEHMELEIMPVLTKESVAVNILQNCEKSDIEIVEEKVIGTKNQQFNNFGSTLTVIDTKDDKEFPRTQYTVHKGPILDIKVFENSFLAASEDGRVYRYNQTSNGILNIYKGHKAAVTCLYVYDTNSADISKEWMFSGSLDGTLRCYNVTTGTQVRDTADIGSPIQCMDEAWGIIFIGTKSGHVSRYHIKSSVIKGNSIQFSDKSVLALKAINEGPRKVLIVASRNQPITIRDAQNGLFLRTICGQKNHTVYSLMRDNNLIYCGTSSTSIPVFDFTNGEQIMQYDAGVGIVCMRLYKQLLFAGCYDGNIYVFDTKDHRLVCSIAGPGNMLLSMEVIDNKIIAGSKDKRLQSWQMPQQIQALL